MILVNDCYHFEGLAVFRCGKIQRGVNDVPIRQRKDGYCTFKHRGKTLYVHRVVCEVFHGTPPEGAEADHEDRDRSNNRETNLSWMTPAENKARRHYPNRRIRREPTLPQHPELRRPKES